MIESFHNSQLCSISAETLCISFGSFVCFWAGLFKKLQMNFVLFPSSGRSLSQCNIRTEFLAKFCMSQCIDVFLIFSTACCNSLVMTRRWQYFVGLSTREIQQTCWKPWSCLQPSVLYLLMGQTPYFTYLLYLYRMRVDSVCLSVIPAAGVFAGRVAELQPLPRPGRCAGVKEHRRRRCCLPFGGHAGTPPSYRTTSHLSFIGCILLSKL